MTRLAFLSTALLLCQCALQEPGPVWRANGLEDTKTDADADTGATHEEGRTEEVPESSERPIPRPPFTLPDSRLSVGVEESCFLTQNSEAYCWGGRFNEIKQLVDDGLVLYQAAQQLSIGNFDTRQGTEQSGNHYCAISDSQLYCGGHNNFGKSGRPLHDDPSVFTGVDIFGMRVQRVSTGTHQSCVVAEGQLFCFGYDTDNTWKPSRVDLDGQVVYDVVTAGHYETLNATACALTELGVYCFDTYLTANSSPSEKWQRVSFAGDEITQIAVYKESACLIRASELYCWGNNEFTVTGHEEGDYIVWPDHVPVKSGEISLEVTQVGLGYKHGCVLADATVYCWGDNTFGKLGRGFNNGSTFVEPGPIQKRDEPATLLAVGAESACAVFLADDGEEVWCWGSQSTEQGVPRKIEIPQD